MSTIKIEFEIQNPKLISVNEQYMHPVRKTKSGKYYSYFAPTPYLKEVKSFYEKILKEKITDEDIAAISSTITDKYHGLKLSIILGLPFNEVRNNDISNYIKSLEDRIVNRTGIDDSRNYEVSIKETLYESESDDWMVKIIIEPVELENYKLL